MYILMSHPDCDAQIPPSHWPTRSMAMSHGDMLSDWTVRWEIRLEGGSDEYDAGWLTTSLGRDSIPILVVVPAD